MKKKLNTFDRIRVVFLIIVFLLAILAFTYDDYYWIQKIVFILLAINLMIMGIQEYRQNKKSLFAYCILVMALLIILLTIFS